MTPPQKKAIEWLRSLGATRIKVGSIEAEFPPPAAPTFDADAVLLALDKGKHDADPERPSRKRSRPDILSDPALGLPSLPDYSTSDDDE